MCILCGELIMNVHWTDQPFHDAEYGRRERIVAGEGQRDRRRMRLRRVAVADKVLSYYGLSIRERCRRNVPQSIGPTGSRAFVRAPKRRVMPWRTVDSRLPS